MKVCTSVPKSENKTCVKSKHVNMLSVLLTDGFSFDIDCA